MRPTEAEYAPFYAGYIATVPEADILPALRRQPEELRAVGSGIPADRETFRYEAGKWSVREVFGHLGDVERILGYRALCISRGERARLPGFEEGDYVRNAAFDAVPLADLVDEFATLRAANVAFLQRLRPEQWERTGTANDSLVSVRALAYILVGHVRHHLGILQSRYGLGAAA